MRNVVYTTGKLQGEEALRSFGGLKVERLILTFKTNMYWSIFKLKLLSNVISRLKEFNLNGTLKYMVTQGNWRILNE